MPSLYSVPETLARLESILKERGANLRSCEYSGEAEVSGPKMSHPVADLWQSEGALH
jgi:hypothetical protein